MLTNFLGNFFYTTSTSTTSSSSTSSSIPSGGGGAWQSQHKKPPQHLTSTSWISSSSASATITGGGGGGVGVVGLRGGGGRSTLMLPPSTTTTTTTTSAALVTTNNADTMTNTTTTTTTSPMADDGDYDVDGTTTTTTNNHPAQQQEGVGVGGDEPDTTTRITTTRVACSAASGGGSSLSLSPGRRAPRPPRVPMIGSGSGGGARSVITGMARLVSDPITTKPMITDGSSHSEKGSEEDDEEEDDVNVLLTQFPTYGTQQQSSTSSVSTLHGYSTAVATNAQDWLFGGFMSSAGSKNGNSASGANGGAGAGAGANINAANTMSGGAGAGAGGAVGDGTTADFYHHPDYNDDNYNYNNQQYGYDNNDINDDYLDNEYDQWILRGGGAGGSAGALVGGGGDGGVWPDPRLQRQQRQQQQQLHHQQQQQQQQQQQRQQYDDWDYDEQMLWKKTDYDNGDTDQQYNTTNNNASNNMMLCTPTMINAPPPPPPPNSRSRNNNGGGHDVASYMQLQELRRQEWLYGNPTATMTNSNTSTTDQQRRQQQQSNNTEETVVGSSSASAMMMSRTSTWGGGGVGGYNDDSNHHQQSTAMYDSHEDEQQQQQQQHLERGRRRRQPPPPPPPPSRRYFSSLAALAASPHHNNNSFASPTWNHSNQYPTQQQQPTRTIVSSEDRQHSEQQQLRQHWMPDQLCKQCYECNTQFTVFRRRHHCRLCGQVFCNTCSAYFIPSTPSTTTTNATIGGAINNNNINTSTTTAPNTSTATVQAITSTNNSPLGPSTGGGNADNNNAPQQQQQQQQQQRTHPNFISTIRVCHMCHDQVVHRTSATTTSPSTAVASTTFERGSNNSGSDGKQQPKPLYPTQTGGITHASTAGWNEASDDEVGDVGAVKEYDFSASSSIQKHQPDAKTKLNNKAQAVVVSAKQQQQQAAPSLSSSSAASTSLLLSSAPQQVIVAADRGMGLSRDHPSIADGNRHMGLTAANHLEIMAEELLRLHAPILWNRILREPSSVSSSLQPLSNKENNNGSSDNNNNNKTLRPVLKSNWINKLLTLTTRCCATVDPDVKKGDLLDIRPYCKIKVIPGGSYLDCAYMSGVLFRKSVSHKRMAREVENPRIMLLDGGIEFTRNENRMASLDALRDAEPTYMELLVGSILKVKPDVLLVSRSVCRQAQELLLKADVILVQYVKPKLMNRISRQTGATIVSSSEHVMNQIGSHMLGKCRRFRLATFRDNEVWVDDYNTTSSSSLDGCGCDSRYDNGGGVTCRRHQKSIQLLLADPRLSNHERQAALAARELGEGVLDGSEAIKSGLAKRGVVQTYVMLEGCPKHLGCTVVLRGASRAALKQVKTVFRFLVNVAYNLRLETSYLKERCARIRADYVVIPEEAYSSSLCVDYGKPANGRKIQPWNGGNGDAAPTLESGEITAFDHQSILITSVWMTEKSQCCPAEVKGICYYSLQDVALGQFLRDSCFNLSLKCQNLNCKKSVLDHSLSFVHRDGRLDIVVQEMDEPLPPSPLEDPADDSDDMSPENDDDVDKPIATWTYCRNCKKVVTPLVFISRKTWKFSFGKFLEVFFYNRDAIMNAPDQQCSCELQSAATLYFGCGNLSARFTYEKVSLYGVYVRKHLPVDAAFHKRQAIHRLSVVSTASSDLFSKFDGRIDAVSSEARALFNTPFIPPEYLQTVLSELNGIGSEVAHASKILQEKIASVSFDDDGCVNEALLRFPRSAERYLYTLTSSWNEKLTAVGQALSAMKKMASSSSHRHDGVNVSAVVGDAVNDELHEGLKRLRKLNAKYSRRNMADITDVLPVIPGSDDLHQDGEFDDDFDDPDGSIDFTNVVDADVLASRRRLQSSNNKHNAAAATTIRPSKTLGAAKAIADLPRTTDNDSRDVPTATKPTAGGAVKSAITRLFNRGNRDQVPYVVDLGMFAEGRPRLPPSANGAIVPVVDDRHSSIIAYSLASAEYAKKLKQLFKNEASLEASMDGEGGVILTKGGVGSGSSHDSDGGSRDSDSRLSRASSDSRDHHIPVLPTGGVKAASSFDDAKGIERRMLVRNKSLIKHKFRDYDEKGQVTCTFVCTTYWATQFHAVRQIFLAPSFGVGKGGGGDETKDQHTEASKSTDPLDVEQGYIESLCSAHAWAASGGKSGASFARTADDRFVIKCISRTELQMFLDCAPAYFEYLSKAFFHGLPTVLCKIVGVYQIGINNKVTNRRSMEQVCIMQNIFYNRKISKTFDLKGSLRGRFAAQKHRAKDENVNNQHHSVPSTSSTGSATTTVPLTSSSSDYNRPVAATPSSNTLRRRSTSSDVSSTVRQPSIASQTDDSEFESGGSEIQYPRTRGIEIHQPSSQNNKKQQQQQQKQSSSTTLLDGDFLAFTHGRPLPLTDRAKAVFQMSILNDTLFLSIINVLDYSILVGFDEENKELVVGIIDFMRQYDIMKQMERVGKSLPMVVGSEAPTIIQPPLYKQRFTNAMEKYFMTVPNKWTTI